MAPRAPVRWPSPREEMRLIQRRFVRAWNTGLGGGAGTSLDDPRFLPPGLVEHIALFVARRPERWREKVQTLARRYLGLLAHSRGLRRLATARIITFDFQGLIPVLLRSPTFQRYMRRIWFSDSSHNRNISYAAVALHPRIHSGSQQDVRRVLEAENRFAIVHRFWYLATLHGRSEIRYQFKVLDPEAFDPDELNRAVQRMAVRGALISDAPRPERIPPLRYFVVFDASAPLGRVREGAIPRFHLHPIHVFDQQTGRFSVHPGTTREYGGLAPEQARLAAPPTPPAPPARPQRLPASPTPVFPPRPDPPRLELFVPREGPAPAPRAVVQSPAERAAAPYRALTQEELDRRLDPPRLQALSYDPTPRVVRGIQRLTPGELRPLVAQMLPIWNRALGRAPPPAPQKMPPLSLLRSRAYWEVISKPDVAKQLFVHYIAMLMQNRMMRYLVERDMLVFDATSELGELQRVLRDPLFERDLRAFRRHLSTPNARFLMFTMRNDLFSHKVSQDIRQGTLVGRSAVRMWIIDADTLGEGARAWAGAEVVIVNLTEIPVRMAHFANPDHRISRRVTHVLGFGNPNVGPPYSTREQVYRLARLHTREEQVRTGELIAPWQYYERTEFRPPAGATTTTTAQS